MANITRYAPRNGESRQVARTWDQLFNDLWENAFSTWERPWSDRPNALARPAMDVVENDNAVTIRVDVPGLKPDDLNIEIEGDMLTISGEMGDTIEQEGERYHYRERVTGSFKRMLRLPDTIDTEHVDANIEHGVLTLSLPKRAESKPKRITVKASK